ncbi:hypothetical protein E4U54_001378 [Claviceps lovelessii]|nr:hypothetical protein E4U54_001378 [Claviceps lovelessii]
MPMPTPTSAHAHAHAHAHASASHAPLAPSHALSRLLTSATPPTPSAGHTPTTPTVHTPGAHLASCLINRSHRFLPPNISRSSGSLASPFAPSRLRSYAVSLYLLNIASDSFSHHSFNYPYPPDRVRIASLFSLRKTYDPVALTPQTHSYSSSL